MEIKDFFLTDDIKKQLGYIIRETRKLKFAELKNSSLIENNPYTKENFCDNNNICHYHTLTKLENELVIKEDSIYDTLLKKLDLYYQVSPSEHNEHMAYINQITKQILHAGEFIDDIKANQIKDEIDIIDYSNDVIAYYYLKLLKIFIKLQLVIKVDENTIHELKNFLDFYHGIHHGIALQCLGIYSMNKLETDLAKSYFLEAKNIYSNNGISKGMISSYLIAVYVYTNDYYHSVPLCNEMEKYYQEMNNYKRLMHVYNYLSDYYFLINAHNVAKEYFDKAIEIINNDEALERFKYSIYYNWAFRCFKDNLFKESLDNFITAYEYCKTSSNKLQTVNMILIIMTKLKYTDDEINIFFDEGIKYYELSNESNKNIFKYFRFKIEKNRYYRKFAYEKIIPMLSEDRTKNEILLFFYEDLYKL